MGLFLLWIVLLGIGCRYWERMEQSLAAPATPSAAALPLPASTSPVA